MELPKTIKNNSLLLIVIAVGGFAVVVFLGVLSLIGGAL